MSDNNTTCCTCLCTYHKLLCTWSSFYTSKRVYLLWSYDLWRDRNIIIIFKPSIYYCIIIIIHPYLFILLLFYYYI